MRECTIDIVRREFSTDVDTLSARYAEATVGRIIRIRDAYAYQLAHPTQRDSHIVEHLIKHYGIAKTMAYKDLEIVKQLLPQFESATKDFHRWRYNEMILATFRKAQEDNDTKTMERAASSYAKFNKVDEIEEEKIPYDKIIPQMFTATDDPTVLGIKPIPNLKNKIEKLIAKYAAETIDIDDVGYEEVDLEEGELWPDKPDSDGDGEESLF